MARAPASTLVSIRLSTALQYDMAMLAEESLPVDDDDSARIYMPWSLQDSPDQGKHEQRNSFIREAISREIDRRLECNRRHLSSAEEAASLEGWLATARESMPLPPYHEAGTEPPRSGRPPGKQNPGGPKRPPGFWYL